MNYHLSSQSTIAREKFSGEAWAKTLNLAVSYGWQPLGTLLPSVIRCCGFEAEDWDGTYLTNDGQTVSAEDALALAVALERALDDIPDFNIETGIDRGGTAQKEDGVAGRLSPVEKAILEAGLEAHLMKLIEIHPFEYFAGEKKLHLAEFIKFCRLGSFTILRI